MSRSHEDTVRALLDRHGQTFAEQAGIRLTDEPSPLYRLLVLSTLLSTRISADIAVHAARELSAAGWRTPQRMLAATWQQRVGALLRPQGARQRRARGRADGARGAERPGPRDRPSATGRRPGARGPGQDRRRPPGSGFLTLFESKGVSAAGGATAGPGSARRCG